MHAKRIVAYSWQKGPYIQIPMLRKNCVYSGNKTSDEHQREKLQSGEDWLKLLTYPHKLHILQNFSVPLL